MTVADSVMSTTAVAPHDSNAHDGRDLRLEVTLGNANDLMWAQQTVTYFHYLRQPVHPQARPMVYVLWGRRSYGGNALRLGLCIVGIPHATRNRRWWGYDDQPTQWQVVDLSRIWLDPAIQQGGTWCYPEMVPGFVDRKGNFRPTVATWLIGQVLRRVQVDRVAMWPPVYPNQPYHIRLAVSYHDPALHKGAIYRLAGAEPMYVSEAGEPVPGPTGKVGWVWRMPEPEWSWREIEILQPRTMRLF